MYYSNPCKREKRLWHSNAIFFYLKKNLHESENVRVNAFFLPEKKMADPMINTWKLKFVNIDNFDFVLIWVTK